MTQRNIYEWAESSQAHLDNEIDKTMTTAADDLTDKMKRIKLPIPQRYGGGHVTGNTITEAVEKLAQRIEAEFKFTEKSKAPLFSECFDKWMKIKEGQEKSETTIAGYKGVARTHILPFFGEMRIDEIKPDDIQIYYNSIRKYSKSMSVQSKAILKGVFERAARNDLISKNPMDYKYEMSKKEGKKVVLQDDDLLETIEHLPLLKEPYLKDYLYACFLCFTGLRRGEILGLRWGEINFDTMTITVNQSVKYPNGQCNPVIGCPKDDSTGEVSLLDMLAERIRGYAGQPTEYVIPYSEEEKERPITKSIFDKMWKRINSKVDLKGATSHSFRHSYATMLQAHSGSTDVKVLQTALRHKTPDLAMKIYTESNVPKTRKAEQEYSEYLRAAMEHKMEHAAERQTA